MGPLTGVPVSTVDFKKSHFPMSLNSQCHMSPVRQPNVTCPFQEMTRVMSLILFLMSLGSMSHVNFKKGPCRRVEFRGLGP